MKKLFVSLLAVAALAACTNEQTLVQRGNAPMEFAGAFVDNATRANVAADPSTTTNSLTGFDVWAFMDEPAGIVFEGENVTGEKGNFSYVNTQYWVPGHVYYFAALAPMDSANWRLNTENANELGAGIVDFHNVDGTEDLLYAATSVSTKGMELGADMDAVKFQFNHLLSKVKFSFTNGFTNDNAYIDVKNVKMVAPAFASINLAQADWWSTNQWALVKGETTTLAFGDACAKTAPGVKQETDDERLTIPAGADQSYIVTFDVALYFGDVLAFEKTGITSKVEGVALEIGKSYNFKAELNASNIAGGGENGGAELMPIEFDVEEVKDWVDGGEHGIVPTTPVATAEELVAALAAGSNVTLTQDINLDSVATRAELQAGLVVNKDLTLDGNGYTITTTAKRALQFIEGGNVTIKNLTLDAPNSERGFQFQADGHNVVIENVTATSGNYTVYLTASSTNSNVVVKNCDLTGLNTINVWGKDHKVNVENTKITTIDNNAAEAYASIYNNAENTTVYVNGGEVVITGSANDSFGGVVIASGASIIFNGTEGTTTIEGQPFVINYDNGYTYSFSTFAEAVETAKDGEIIVMTQDVTIDNVLKVTDKNVTFNLNGHNISSTTDVFEVAGGALTIIGDGVVHAATSNGTPYCAVWAYNDAVVNIYGGTYKIGYPTGDYNDLIYAKGNAVINIYDGTFHNSGRENAFVLNVNDQNRATASINVYGGSYENFNPADNLSEGANTNFVASGKTVEENNGWYIVK